MRAVGHVGISVPDIEAAIEWYSGVFGLEQIGETGTLSASDDGVIADAATDIFGPQFRGVKMAHLASANGVAVELFQFLEPAYAKRDDDFDYWRGGIFHFAFVARDIERVVRTIEERGGRRLSGVDPLFDGRSLQVCYCQDPWGTVVEVMTESHERAFANIG
jgi:catechol 2,3-dioxygenase-like lactoylglutathione lyase family enzyme